MPSWRETELTKVGSPAHSLVRRTQEEKHSGQTEGWESVTKEEPQGQLLGSVLTKRKPRSVQNNTTLFCLIPCSWGSKALHSSKINGTASEQHMLYSLPVFLTAICGAAGWQTTWIKDWEQIFSYLYPAMLSLKIIKNRSPPSFPTREGFASCLSCTQSKGSSNLCKFPTATNTMSQQKKPDTVKKRKKEREWSFKNIYTNLRQDPNSFDFFF